MIIDNYVRIGMKVFRGYLYKDQNRVGFEIACVPNTYVSEASGES